MHAPDAADEAAGVLAQYLVAVHVVAGGRLHGGADEALRAREVEAGAHVGVAEDAFEVLYQRLVARVDAQFGNLPLLQLGEEVLAGKGFAGVEQGDVQALSGHIVQQP
ncbi:hypothetical protein D3C81_1732850 [compost metagenome]